MDSVMSFLLLIIMNFRVELVDSKEPKVVTFIKENLKELKIKEYKCLSSKLSYLMWLKSVGLDTALFCSFSILNDGATKEKQLIWMLIYDIYKEKKLSKKKNFVLKQASSINKRHYLKRNWYFLGPFQIGKPELDGNPIEKLEDMILNRWSTKYYAYSELVNSGHLKWQTLQSDVDGNVNVQPQVNWNELVMSLQSLAATEWQGVLVNEFYVLADRTSLLFQCMGTNLFHIDDIVVNGDIYYRSQYWYPVSLDAGLHIIKVPIRKTGIAPIKCSIKKPSTEKQISIHEIHFAPDLVDGNWFSFYCSITATNLNVDESVKVTGVSMKNSDLEDGNVVSELADMTIFKPGQVNSIIVKFIPSVDKVSTKCIKTSYVVTLTLKFSNGKKEDVGVSLRCRDSHESFLFTFLDHDGSVQHAAAIKPLKPCLLDACPVLLTHHGTGVKASNQADSYKRMVKKKFVFGVEKLWVLAPTRFGAHNWEGPGELTSLQALESLAALTERTSWLAKPADENAVVFAGHSMGGHGAWQLSIHHPDRAVAVISAAGWLSKEDYGDSNLLYRHDISVSHTDPIVKAIQESCVAENQADKHASNLKGVPVMIRVGANDKTVHPYFSRRMFRLLKEYKVNVTYREIGGKEHWWWDTDSENDGGVTNDLEIRNFAISSVEKLELERKKDCSTEGCEENDRRSIYTSHYESRSYGVYNYVVYNPASFYGGRGVKVLQQIIPFRVSKYTIKIDQSNVDITTTNIKSLQLYEPSIGKIGWNSKTVTLDGVNIGKLEGSLPWRFCRSQDLSFKPCEWTMTDFESSEVRGPKNYGPARRIAEDPFMIVICDNGKDIERDVLRNSALLLANFFMLTSDTRVNIYSSNDVSMESMSERNVILIGTDTCTEQMGVKKLILFEKESIRLGKCIFHGHNHSAMYLLPHAVNKLMLLLTGHNAQSIHKYVMSLSVPTIPPMTRSPFSNLIPDYVILSPDVLAKGPGGYTCAGFWNNYWQYDVSSSSCSC